MFGRSFAMNSLIRLDASAQTKLKKHVTCWRW